MTDARPSKRWRRLALALASTVVALALAEIVCRVDAFFPGAPYDAARARAWLELRAGDDLQRDLEAFGAPDPEARDSSVRPVLHPYLGWSNERAIRNLEAETRWYQGSEHAGTFDVLVLGGSVAADFGNHAPEGFARALAEAPLVAGRPVRVWNEGQAGYKAPQTAHLLAWLLELGHAPDAVVLIDGFNEVAVATSNAEAGQHPGYPFVQYWGELARDRALDVRDLDLLLAIRGAQHRVRAVSATALARGYVHSALLTRWTLARVRAIGTEYEAARAARMAYLAQRPPERAVHGPEFAPAPDDVVALQVALWTENSRNAAALCRARGIAFLHVLQPTLHDAGAKTLTDEERRRGGADSAWLTGVTRGYPKLRAGLARLAESGVPVFDATRVFEHETGSIYVDICHVDEHGNALLVDAVGAELARRLR